MFFHLLAGSAKTVRWVYVGSPQDQSEKIKTLQPLLPLNSATQKQWLQHPSKLAQQQQMNTSGAAAAAAAHQIWTSPQS